MILPFLAEITAVQGPESSFWEAFMRMLLSLGVILVILYIVLWILRRTVYGKIQGGDENRRIKVIEFRPLSHKTTLYIIEADGTRLLYVESQHGAHTSILPKSPTEH